MTSLYRAAEVTSPTTCGCSIFIFPTGWFRTLPRGYQTAEIQNKMFSKQIGSYFVCFIRESLSDNIQADVAEAFQSSPRYLENVFNIGNPYFQHITSQTLSKTKQILFDYDLVADLFLFYYERCLFLMVNTIILMALLTLQPDIWIF